MIKKNKLLYNEKAKEINTVQSASKSERYSLLFSLFFDFRNIQELSQEILNLQQEKKLQQQALDMRKKLVSSIVSSLTETKDTLADEKRIRDDAKLSDLNFSSATDDVVNDEDDIEEKGLFSLS